MKSSKERYRNLLLTDGIKKYYHFCLQLVREKYQICVAVQREFLLCVRIYRTEMKEREIRSGVSFFRRQIESPVEFLRCRLLGSPSSRGAKMTRVLPRARDNIISLPKLRAYHCSYLQSVLADNPLSYRDADSPICNDSITRQLM
jgi:hypothetical protein